MNLLERLLRVKYINSLIILCADVLLSLMASLLAILFTKTVSRALSLTHDVLVAWFVGSLVFSLLSLYLWKTHLGVIRHSTLRSMSRLFMASLCKFAMLVVLILFVSEYGITAAIRGALLIDVLLTFTLLMVMRISVLVFYYYIQSYYSKRGDRKNVLVYGTSDKSVAVTTRLANSSHYRVIGFITPEGSYQKINISDHKTFPFKDARDIERLQRKYGVDAVLFANEEDARAEQKTLVKYCIDSGLTLLITPTIDEVVDGKVMKQTVRKVKIEDLLGRDEIKISEKEIREEFTDKVVMVTGAAGSIGSELCRQLVGLGVKKLILFDNAETPMHNLRLELEERFPELNFVPVIGDVRQEARLEYAFLKWKPQVVFHAAAYKHVPLMEENPCEAVLVNVIGSRNVADMCLKHDVEKMVMVSTDKAVNPTNIMGCTKRLAEIYVQSLGLAIEKGTHAGRTKFVTTRFGNVLGSNGSVIPRFREQIAKGGPITVTHPEITRFFMSIPEACRLVMEAATMSTGNQIFVFDMGKSVKIADLAKRMIRLSGLTLGKDIDIEYTGLRPGEKLYEEVLSNTENTLPTPHNRIRIAKVREYDYDDARQVTTKLEVLSRAVEIPDMVKLMKSTVPEYKSKNSIYEQYDVNEEPDNA